MSDHKVRFDTRSPAFDAVAQAYPFGELRLDPDAFIARRS